MYEWKIIVNKDSAKIYKKIESPLDKEFKDTLIETIGSDDLKKYENLNIVVNKIEPEIKNDTLISLTFYASEFKSLESSQTGIKTNETDSEKKLIIIGKDELPWRIYKDLLIEPTRWLLKNNRIQKKDLPIYDVSHGKRYLLHYEPKHSTEREFDSFEKIDLLRLLEESKISGWGDLASKGIYLHTNYASSDCKRNGEYLMKKFAQEVEFKILGF